MIYVIRTVVIVKRISNAPEMGMFATYHYSWFIECFTVVNRSFRIIVIVEMFNELLVHPVFAKLLISIIVVVAMMTRIQPE